MVLDAVVSLVSLFGPKVMDLVKGVVHRKDSPEATMAALAQTNPAELANYVHAQAALMTAQNESVKVRFSADMPDPTLVPKWLVAWRSAIRPAIITISWVHITATIVMDGYTGVATVPEWLRFIYESANASWMGDRWKLS